MNYGIVARYQGGANAGHTVYIRGRKYVVHLVPSGIFRPRTACLMGNGMVIDLKEIIREVQNLNDAGISTYNRLFISTQAHIIFPYHKRLEKIIEESKGKSKIGTTLKGIGLAYLDKINRCGIRIFDIMQKSGEEKIKNNLENTNKLIKEIYGKDLPSLSEELADVMETIESFKTLLSIGAVKIVDAPALLHEYIQAGQDILIEGAQATLLDIDHGTYPYVTSSSPSAGGACTGLGIGPTMINYVTGIVKSYVTRVGEGPFPTEEKGGIGRRLQKEGKEFGATTGRPRRCGWFDQLILKYAVLINGLTSMAITKLDILDKFKEIKVCTAYELPNGERITEFVPHIDVLSSVKPIYKTLPG